MARRNGSNVGELSSQINAIIREQIEDRKSRNVNRATSRQRWNAIEKLYAQLQRHDELKAERLARRLRLKLHRQCKCDSIDSLFA